jgi:hypothetical protein
MDAKIMEKNIKELQKKVAVLEDLESIKRLQRTYGYYLEHWLYKELIDLFSDRSDTKLDVLVGVFQGKKGVRRFFNYTKTFRTNPDLLHQVMQLSGVVDIAQDGKTAAGRWYGFGTVSLAFDHGVTQSLMNGIYTMEYIKEDGIWKIWKIVWNPTVIADPGPGWVKPEKLLKRSAGLPPPPSIDKPRTFESRYPSGYIPPFHYPHPVTGKPTSEHKHNKAVKLKNLEKKEKA